MNFLDPSSERDGCLRFDVLDVKLAAPAGGGAVRLGIRPEYVRVLPPGTPGTVPARVLRRCITVGGQTLLTLAAGSARLKAKVAPGTEVSGSEVSGSQVSGSQVSGGEVPASAAWGSGAATGSEVGIVCPLEHAVLFRHGQRLPDAPAALVAAPGRVGVEP